MLGRADPVRVDRLRRPAGRPRRASAAGTSPPPSSPARPRPPGPSSRMPVGRPRRPRDDRHHLRGEPAEVLARLLVGDRRSACRAPTRRRGGPSRPGGRTARSRSAVLGSYGSGSGMAESRSSSTRSPQTFSYGNVADELVDVDAAVAKLTPLAVGLGDLGLDGDDALETRLELAHPATESTGRPSRRRAPVESAADGAPRHPHSRRRHRARADRGDAPRARGDRRRVRLGRARGRRRRDGDGGHAAARRDARLDPRQQGRAQGPDHDADRHRLPLGQRRAAARARPLRLPAAVQDLPGRALALRGRRRRHRPREHRGPVRRHRVRVRQRRTPTR